MRPRWIPALVGLVLLAPPAAAWAATFESTPSEVSLRESLLLAGALVARADGGAFGAPEADLLTFDAPVTVRMCPDQAGEMQSGDGCAGGQTTTEARLYVRAGGLVALAPPAAGVELRAGATAAALGGPNVTLNGFSIGPGVYSGGATVVTANATTLALRPLRSVASLELRGNEGFRTYNGTAYTLYVSNFTAARLEAGGAFVGGPAPDAALTAAGLRRAEAGIRVDELYELLRALQPAERADRRADLADAFGPFQVVPALLDGAAAARTNLTLNGEPRGATFVRLQDLRLAYADARWSGSGNASYLVEGGLVASQPGASAAMPIVLPLLLAAAAVTARVLTARELPRRSRRILADVLRGVGLLALCFAAGAALAPLLGFSPLVDARVLEWRSRIQLALLAAGIVGFAWLGAGLAVESLARSAFAWRDRPRAVLLPVLAGLAATAVFFLLATAPLLSWVARLVRL